MRFKDKAKQTGQSLVEYAIIIVVVALAIFSLLAAYGEEVVALYRRLTEMW